MHCIARKTIETHCFIASQQKFADINEKPQIYCFHPQKIEIHCIAERQ